MVMVVITVAHIGDGIPVGGFADIITRGTVLSVYMDMAMVSVTEEVLATDMVPMAMDAVMVMDTVAITEGVTAKVTETAIMEPLPPIVTLQSLNIGTHVPKAILRQWKTTRHILTT